MPNLNSSESLYLSYLRSLAIIVIVFGHVGGFWKAEPYSSYLHVFVSIFFFLSGVVSHLSYTRKPILKKYYIKRLVSLTVPYYLICGISLIVYIINNANFPEFNFINFNQWLQIRPIRSIRPFPIGQVWFLNTLFFITLLSPLYFFLIKKQKTILLIVITSLLTISYLKQIDPSSIGLRFLGNDIYRPLIHSIFFIFGAYLFTLNSMKQKKLIIGVLVLSLFGSFILLLMGTDIQLSKHNLPPTLYYVLVSLISISVFMLLKNLFLFCVEKIPFIASFFKFCHKHTFSIFLLHTLAIYIVEELNVLYFFTEKSITYGLIKFILVMILTCILSPLFTNISTKIIKQIIK